VVPGEPATTDEPAAQVEDAEAHGEAVGSERAGGA
jgi:hypothetical protein